MCFIIITCNLPIVSSRPIMLLLMFSHRFSVWSLLFRSQNSCTQLYKCIFPQIVFVRFQELIRLQLLHIYLTAVIPNTCFNNNRYDLDATYECLSKDGLWQLI